MGQKVLVTGANGFIARELITHLSDYSDQIHLTSRSRRLVGFNLPYQQLDLSDQESLQNLLDGLVPDLIIHTAAISSVDYATMHKPETKSINVDSIKTIANWCAENDSRLVHFSSDFVFDGEKGVYEESDLPNPLSYYGQTKLESEEVVKSTLQNHLIIRPILVYGLVSHMPRLNFPIWVVSQLTSGKKTFITADQIRKPTYVSDLAKATAELSFSSYNGTVNICGDDEVNMYEFAVKVARVFGLDESLLVASTSSEINQAGMRPKKTTFSNQLVKQLIDFKPTPIDDALTEMSRKEMKL